MPIRNTNGTVLSPSGIAEVRLGDGTVISSLNTVLEDFEGDLSGYTGDTADASVQTATVKNGDQALQLDGTAYIVNDGISIDQGTTHRFWIRETGPAEGTGIIYFASNTASTFSGYHLRINSGTDDFTLFNVSDGSFEKLAERNLNVEKGTWYEIEFSVSSTGDHTATLYNEAGDELSTLSATDTTHSSGGIGWRAFQGTAFADYLLVTQ